MDMKHKLKVSEGPPTYVSSLAPVRCRSANLEAIVLESSPNPYNPATAAITKHHTTVIITVYVYTYNHHSVPVPLALSLL